MIKSKRTFGIELDGLLYHYTGDELRQIQDIDEIDGPFWFVTDMQNVVSRTMMIEAPVKYADVMVRKKIQESGDFDEPVSVITHWKKSKGPNTSEIFFSAIPSRVNQQYLDQLNENENNVLFFPLYSLLYAALKKIGSTKPSVLVFQHDRYADILIGTANRVYYANRCVAFDISEEQIKSLWSSIQSDIQHIEAEHRIKVGKVYCLNWIESSDTPSWLTEKEYEIVQMKKEEIKFHESTHLQSLTPILNFLPAKDTTLPFKAYFAFLSKKIVPFINILTVFAILVLGYGYYSYTRKIETIHSQIGFVEKKIKNTKFAPPKTVSLNYYNETLNFIRELSFLRKAPPYKSILADISSAMSSRMEINVLNAEYSLKEVQIEIFGEMTAPFKLAHKEFNHFRSGLKQKGYIIREDRFNTEINESTFLLKMAKSIL